MGHPAAFGTGRWPSGEQFTCIRTIAALRQYSVEGLNRIADVPNGDIEKEISIILKSLKVKKNLLLFYPYMLEVKLLFAREIIGDYWQDKIPAMARRWERQQERLTRRSSV